MPEELTLETIYLSIKKEFMVVEVTLQTLAEL